MIGIQRKSLRLPDIVTLIGLCSAFTGISLLWKDGTLLLPAYFCILGQIFADFWTAGLPGKWEFRIPSECISIISPIF